MRRGVDRTPLRNGRIIERMSARGSSLRSANGAAPYQPGATPRDSGNSPIERAEGPPHLGRAVQKTKRPRENTRPLKPCLENNCRSGSRRRALAGAAVSEETNDRHGTDGTVGGSFGNFGRSVVVGNLRSGTTLKINHTECKICNRCPYTAIRISAGRYRERNSPDAGKKRLVTRPSARGSPCRVENRIAQRSRCRSVGTARNTRKIVKTVKSSNRFALGDSWEHYNERTGIGAFKCERSCALHEDGSTAIVSVFKPLSGRDVTRKG